MNSLRKIYSKLPKSLKTYLKIAFFRIKNLQSYGKTTSIIKQIDRSLTDEIKVKYRDKKLIDTKIGNRVWVMWYQGFNSAPPIVKECVKSISAVPDIDLVLLDKNNLEQYFTYEGQIRKLFTEKKISIQTFSDIVRLQLLSRWGVVVV